MFKLANLSLCTSPHVSSCPLVIPVPYLEPQLSSMFNSYFYVVEHLELYSFGFARNFIIANINFLIFFVLFHSSYLLSDLDVENFQEAHLFKTCPEFGSSVKRWNF